MALALTLTFSGAAQGVANPVPLINQPLIPSSAAPGSGAFTLTVNGTGFVASSVVNWNGSARATTFVSASQLTAAILAGDNATAITASITVLNPGSPATISNVVFLPVSNSTTKVSLGKTDFVTGVNPQSVAAGDFNGDGFLDLAIANTNDNTVSILLGDGVGNFTAQPAVATGSGPQWVIAADFNNDGKLDLAVANNNANTLTILLGDGTGKFTPTVASPVTASGPVALAAADFNHDGNLDLAVVDSPAKSISILLGNGDGTFQAKKDFPTGTGPTGLAVGDIDRDGFLDLVVADKSSGSVSILLGKGDGTFNAKVDIAVASAPTSVVLADFTGDGVLDLAIADQGANKISFLKGNGDGTFQTGVPATTGSAPTLALAGDFNGDGKLDLAVTNRNGSTVSVLLGNGDGTFQTNQDFPTGAAPLSIALGDFNGDGRLDLASANSGPSANTVSVLLQVPAVGFSPPKLSFGNQAVGSTSAGKPLILSNAGSAQLTVQSITITGTNSGDFAQTNTCGTLPAQFAPGAICTITGTFTPTATGARAGTISVADNAAGSPQTVALTGVGTAPAVTLSSVSLPFISLDVGQTSAAQIVTLTNSGTGTLNFTNLSVTGDFTQANSCLGPPASLAPGQTCTISIKFVPTATGTRTGAVNITDDASNSPQAIALSGTGVIPIAVLAPGAGLTFTDQLVGTTSTSQTVTVDNTGGSGPLLITSLVASGDFAQTNTCGSSVGVGTCTITVTFKPTATGTRVGAITIIDNNNGVNGTIQSVGLTGNGTAPSVTPSPASIAFGNQADGTTSAGMTVTLTNTGTGPLTVARVALSGTNLSDFSQSNTCIGTDVAVSAACTITVTFTPSARGARAATLTITDNNNGTGGSTQTVALTGTGTGPSLTVTPATLSFPTQIASTSSTPQIVTLTNNGESLDSIISITATPAAFTETNTCGSSLAPGASCTISVTFLPKTGGAFGGSVSINDTAPGHPQKVTLSGTSSDFSASATPPSVTLAAGQSTQFLVTLTPAGGFNQAVTVSCGSLPTQSSCTFFPSGPVTLDGTNPASVIVTLATTLRTMVAPPEKAPRWPGFGISRYLLPYTLRLNKTAPLVALWLLALAGLAGFATMARRRFRMSFSTAALGLLLAAALGLPACGSSTFTTLPGGTPAGTYMVKLTGTSGTLTHSTTATLTVN